MIETLNSIADKWLDWEFAIAWQIAVLIAIIWVIDLLIRKWAWPQVRYALWLLVLVKLVLPPTLTSPASLTAVIPSLAQSSVKLQIEPPLTTPEVTQFVESVEPVEVSTNENVNYSIETAAEPITADFVAQSVEPDASAVVSLSWKVYAFFVWLAGIAFLASWLILRLTGLRREHLKSGQQSNLPDDFIELLKATANRLNLKKMPQVILTNKVCCPAVFGVFRPVLLMPSDKLNNITRQDLEHILLHELAHIKRGDLFIHGIHMMLQIVFWFNPLLWVIRKQLQNLRELCCDATVAKILKEKTFCYRETLLETARQLLAEPVDPGLGLLGLFESSNRLVERLKWLERKTWKNRPLMLASTITLVAVMLGCVLPMAKGDYAKDRDDWMKPTERWKAKAIKETSLNSFFGGWKNLSFEISAEEEQSVKRCTTLFVRWYDMEADVAENARKELESVLAERPEFFYAEFLLGMWHRDYGDKQVGTELIKKAYEHAPVILVQKYQDEDGQPIAGLEIQNYHIECNKVKKGSLSQFDLKFRDLITDDDGCVYVPVYDTVYRTNGKTLPSDYNIAYPTLGFFKTRSKVALMPIAKNNSTDGGLYERAKSSKDFKVKVGPTKFEAHSVIRWQRNGNPIIKNPNGSEKRIIGMEIPDFSSQAKWMDIAQVHLSPAPEEYEVIELRVFDHTERKLLNEKDYLAVGYERRDVSVNLFSVGKLLPEKIDVWMRVLHVPDTKKVWQIKPQVDASAEIDGNTLNILAVRDGGDYGYSSSPTGITWKKHDIRTDKLATTIALKFNKPDKKQYQICAVSKDHKRYVPDYPHFIRGANSIHVLTFGFPKDQINHFEVSPFISRDTLYFDGIKLPDIGKDGSNFSAAPELRFLINGKEGQFNSGSLSPFNIKLEALNNKKISGYSSSTESWRCQLHVDDSVEGTSAFGYRIDGLLTNNVKLSYYDRNGIKVDTGKPYRQGVYGFGNNLTLGYDSLKKPIGEIHSVGLQIGIKDVPGENKEKVRSSNSVEPFSTVKEQGLLPEDLLEKMIVSRSRAKNLQFVAEYRTNDTVSGKARAEQMKKEMEKRGLSKQQIQMMTKGLSEVPKSRFQILKCTVDNLGHAKIERTSGSNSNGNKVFSGDLNISSWDGKSGIDFNQRKGFPGYATIKDVAPTGASRQGHPWRTFTGTFIDALRKAIDSGTQITVNKVEDFYDIIIEGDIVKHVGIIKPSIGYSCTKEDIYRNGQLSHRRVVKYKEIGNGIWFPICGEMKSYLSDGSLRSISTVTSEDIKVNEPGFNITFFEVDFPEGTEVQDNIQGKKYVVGSDKIYELGESETTTKTDSKNVDDIVTAIENTASKADPDNWRKAFDAVYRLEDSEVLKWNAPPFIPERQNFFLNQPGRNLSNTNYDYVLRYVFHWDGKLNRPGMLSGIGISRLDSVLESVIGLGIFEFQGPDELLHLPMPGDWIVRKGVSKKELLSALEKIILADTGREVHFEKRTVQEDVIVVDGEYQFKPLEGLPQSQAVHISTDSLDDNAGSGGGSGTLERFLKWVGNRVNMKLVDQTESTDFKMSWRNHYSSRMGKLEHNEAYDKKLQLLLNNLKQQTGLSFKRQTGVVEKWFVVEDGKTKTEIGRASKSVTELEDVNS